MIIIIFRSFALLMYPNDHSNAAKEAKVPNEIGSGSTYLLLGYNIHKSEKVDWSFLLLCFSQICLMKVR